MIPVNIQDMRMGALYKASPAKEMFFIIMASKKGWQWIRRACERYTFIKRGWQKECFWWSGYCENDVLSKVGPAKRMLLMKQALRKGCHCIRRECKRDAMYKVMPAIGMPVNKQGPRKGYHWINRAYEMYALYKVRPAKGMPVSRACERDALFKVRLVKGILLNRYVLRKGCHWISKAWERDAIE